MQLHKWKSNLPEVTETAFYVLMSNELCSRDLEDGSRDRTDLSDE